MADTSGGVQTRRVERFLDARLHSVPDLVDQIELAERLAIASDSLNKMRERRFFPEPHFRFKMRDLWWWPLVRTWARRPGRSMRKLQPDDSLPSVDLVGLSDIADRLKVPERTLRFWLQSGKLVAPDYRWSHTNVWCWNTIETWAIGPHRRPSDTPMWTRFAAKLAEARSLLADDPVAELDRLKRVLEEMAAEESLLLRTQTVSEATEFDLAEGAAPLDRFDNLRDLLDDLPRELHE